MRHTTKICKLYWRKYLKSGCAIAGFHCNQTRVLLLTEGGIDFNRYQRYVRDDSGNGDQQSCASALRQM